MTNKSGNYVFPLTVIGILFFIFGFITWANSQLIPYLRTACQLTYTESYFVTSAFFAAYFFMSIPSSYILKWLGFKKGMAVGLFIMAMGAILFIPAAKMIYYPLFLTGLFIMGTGVALLQTASNPYVTILGPIESAAQRISIMGVCNKLAGFIAVHLLGFLFMDNIDEIEQSLQTLSTNEKTVVLQDLANKVIYPYIIITILFVLLGILLIYINLPEPNEEEDNPEHTHGEAPSVFGHRNLVLGAVAIFCYVGVEVISYDAFTDFGISLGFTKQVATKFASYTAIAMLFGYFASIVLIPKYLKQRTALILSSVLSIALLSIALVSNGYIAVISFALLGFSQSAMWPVIWPLALNGLGRHTKIASAILVMMIVGGAIIPPLMTQLALALDSKRLGFLIMIPAWLFLIYYATKGYQSEYADNDAV